MNLILALLLTFAFQSAFANKGVTDSDSGIYGVKYAEFETLFTELQTEQPWIAEKIIYGKSLEGRDLLALKIKAKQYNIPKAPLILITGAIHGDEYLNISDRLAQWFLYDGLKTQVVQSFINAGGEILIVPVVNPDGYEARRRTNANGIDLNRDFDNLKANFKGFTQPESIAMARLVYNEVTSQNLRLAVTMDYHCCSGDMLYPYSYTGPTMPDMDLQRYFKIRDISYMFLKVQLVLEEHPYYWVMMLSELQKIITTKLMDH